jgi:heme/copper-type cytochrome/quinol oxidase subunit 4
MSSKATDGENEEMSRLGEENERLRAQLAEMQAVLAKLQEKRRQVKVTNARSDTDQVQAQAPSQIQGRRRNYHEWMSPEHQLISQEDSEEMVIDQDRSLDAAEKGDKGLRHRNVHSSQLLHEDPENLSLRLAFMSKLKRKLSDDPASSSPSGSFSSVESEMEPAHEPFLKVLSDRAGWLVGLLILQSCSSFILKKYEELLQSHLVLVQFLTMLVGAGGNAGNQASVRGEQIRKFLSLRMSYCVALTFHGCPLTVIRGLAVGTVRDDNVTPFLWKEMRIGFCLSLILGVVGCVRAAVFLTPLAETMAITVSLIVIVMISVVIGATLPLLMNFMRIDPAHSSTTIQVLMDILGVTITVCVSGAILHSSFGEWLSPSLHGNMVNTTQK